MQFRAHAATAAAILVVSAAGHVAAGEVVAGAYGHDLGPAHRENGADFLVGWRSGPVDSLKLLGRPSLYVSAAANTSVPTDWLVAGFAWKFPITDRFYVRPNIGMGYTTGIADRPSVTEPGISAAERARRLHLYETRINFGGHWQFNPGLSAGYRISKRLAAELSYEHLSNGQILHQGDNEGLDDIGLRLIYAY